MTITTKAQNIKEENLLQVIFFNNALPSMDSNNATIE